jgi:hypothetical protein
MVLGLNTDWLEANIRVCDRILSASQVVASLAGTIAIRVATLKRAALQLDQAPAASNHELCHHTDDVTQY